MSFCRALIVGVAAFSFSMTVFATDNTPQSPLSTSKEVSSSSTTTSSPNPSIIQKLNINTAAAKQLVKVKGLNRTKAAAIVSYRKNHGDFKSLDDLKAVKGFKRMNDKTLRHIQEQLSV